MASCISGLVLASASYAQAQFGGYGGGNPYSNGGNGGFGSGGGSNSGNPFADGFGPFGGYNTIIAAHAVLAAVAFAVIFPVGGIIIRLASWPGLWWIHGVFQIIGYLLYVAAFAIGVYLATSLHLLSEAHAIIGIVLFVVLFFQPLLGWLHHTMYKKHTRRVVWSYGHIWLGRIVITLGIINGGLGLQLAQRTPFARPPSWAIIVYSVVAGVIWLIYVASAIYGEAKRAGNSARGDIQHPPRYYKERPGDSDSGRRSRRHSRHRHHSTHGSRSRVEYA